MRVSAVDRVSNLSEDQALPLRLMLTPCPLTTVKFALLALPALAVATAAIGLALTLALNTPEAYSVFLVNPAALVPFAIGFLLLAPFAAYPVRHLFRRLGRSTYVEIDGQEVHLFQQTIFAKRSTTKPLNSYLGVTKRARTSLTGTSHETVLVPADGSTEILLSLENTPGSGTAAQLAQLLLLPLLDSSDPHRDQDPQGSSRAPAHPQPSASPAMP